MLRYIVYPYKMYSKSAKLLSSALNSIRVRPDGRYRARWKDLVVNWGSSTIPTWYARILNNPESVANATNKLKTLRILKESNVRTPEFSTERSVAEQWITDGCEVYCRKQLVGHSGQGIKVARVLGDLDSAPLYTKHVKAKYEFRVHIFRGTVLDVQQKRKRMGVVHNPRIRNHSNGYIYARADIFIPDTVKEEALKAVAALKLDFGAVDVGYVVREDKAYVYEVNTAPGLEGTTLSIYTNAIREYANGI